MKRIEFSDENIIKVEEIKVWSNHGDRHAGKIIYDRGEWVFQSHFFSKITQKSLSIIADKLKKLNKEWNK